MVAAARVRVRMPVLVRMPMDLLHCRLCSSTTRNWRMLPSGARWCLLQRGSVEDTGEVQTGQVVRVEYAARLDDGREITRSVASWRLGSNSASICEVLDEVTPGMRLGDMRRYVRCFAMHFVRYLSDDTRPSRVVATQGTRAANESKKCKGGGGCATRRDAGVRRATHWTGQ